jgi:hypothetical protein
LSDQVCPVCCLDREEENPVIFPKTIPVVFLPKPLQKTMMVTAKWPVGREFPMSTLPYPAVACSESTTLQWRRPLPLQFSLLDHNFCIFQPIWKPKHVLEAQFYNFHLFLNFHLFDDFYFQNGGNIQDGVYQNFLCSGVLNC